MLEYTIAIIGAFLLSSICGFFFIPALLNFCKRKNLYDMPNQRKVHKCLVPRLGGISFMPSMLLSFFIVTIIMGTQSVDAKITISTWTLDHHQHLDFRAAHQPPHHLFHRNRGRLDRS